MKVVGKQSLSIRLVSKEECKVLLDKHHYLTGISKGFKSGINFGLICDGDVVGVCIFTGSPVPELAKSMFGREWFYEELGKGNGCIEQTNQE